MKQNNPNQPNQFSTIGTGMRGGIAVFGGVSGYTGLTAGNPRLGRIVSI